MASMKVKVTGDVACLQIKRSDGHELSLSSHQNMMAEFHGSECVTDYGSFTSVDEFLRVAREFVDAEGQS